MTYPNIYRGLKGKTSSGVVELCLIDLGKGKSGLRIRKGGVTYDIYVVDVTGPYASPFRVRVSGQTKAIRLYAPLHNDQAAGHTDTTTHYNWTDHIDDPADPHQNWSHEHTDQYTDNHTDTPHGDWTDHGNSGTWIDWWDSYLHGDWGDNHTNWDNGHSDQPWYDYNCFYGHEDTYFQWTDETPHVNWSDSYTQWYNQPHSNYSVWSNWNDGTHGNWSDWSDT